MATQSELIEEAKEQLIKKYTPLMEAVGVAGKIEPTWRVSINDERILVEIMLHIPGDDPITDFKKIDILMG